MASKQEFREQVVDIVTELAGTTIGEELLAGLMEDDLSKVIAAMKSAENEENVAWYQKIVSFGEEFKNAIANDETDKGDPILKADEIDTWNTYLFSIYAGFDVFYLFDTRGPNDEFNNFVDNIEKITNKEFAEFVESYNVHNYLEESIEYDSIYELLLAIFSGKLTD